MDPFYLEAYLRGVTFRLDNCGPGCVGCVSLDAHVQPPKAFRTEAKLRANDIRLLLMEPAEGRA